MRESLTIIALALIVALTAALLGPYFYDWSQARQLIETRLSDTLGMSVKISGSIDVKLLPTPYLVAENITTSPRKNTQGQSFELSLRAHSLRMELAPLSLLSGNFTFTDLTLDQPEIEVFYDKDIQNHIQLPSTPPQSVHLEHIVLNDGTLSLVDHDHQLIKLSHIAATGNASSLIGPFKLDGSFKSATDSIDFHFNSAAAESNQIRLKLALASRAQMRTVSLEGALRLQDPGFDGSAKSTGRLNLAGQSVPFALSGAVHLDPAHGSSDKFDLLLGEDETSLKFTGTAAYDYGPKPRLTASLTATTLDLDRVLASNSDQKLHPADVAILARQVFNESLAQNARLAGQFDVNIDSLILGEDSLTSLHLAADTSGSSPFLLLSGRAPANTEFRIEGSLAAPASSRLMTVFDGKAEIEISHFARLQRWYYGAETEKFPFFHIFAFNGPVHIENGFESPNAKVTLDRSHLKGSLTFAPAQASNEGQLSANMSSDDLDLDAIPDFGDMQTHIGALEIKLDAKTLRPAKFGQGSLSAGHIQLDMLRRDKLTQIRALKFENGDGASLAASGEFTPKGSNFSAHLNAPQFGALSSLLQSLFPGSFTTALKVRAAALAPVQLDFTADKADNNLGNLANWRKLSIVGTMAGTKIALALPDSDHASLHLESPRSSSLLTQLGLASLPIDSSGKNEINIKAWDLTQTIPHIDLNAVLSGTELSASGQISDTDHSINGQWVLKSNDAAPLMQTLAILLPDVQTRLPLNIKGMAKITGNSLDINRLDGTCATSHVNGHLLLDWSEGTRLNGNLNLDKLDISTLISPVFGYDLAQKPGTIWPETPFQTSLGDLPDSRIDFKINTLALGTLNAQDTSFGLKYSPGQISLNALRLHLWDGQITGAASLRRNGSQGSLSADTEFDGLKINSSSLNGLASGKLNFAGTGQNWAGLISGLAGTGTMALTNGYIRMLPMDGLARIVAAAEQDQIASEELNLTKALDTEFDKGKVDIAPAPLNMTMANGQIKFGPAHLALKDAPPVWNAGYDLRNGQFTLATSLTQSPLPKGWGNMQAPSININWSGPLATAPHKLDLANLTNALSARAIARSQSRIEDLDADIRERSFFLRRLKASQATTLRQKAEDELRKKTESEELLRTIKDFLQPQAAPPAPYKPLPPPSLQHGAPLELIQPQP